MCWRGWRGVYRTSSGLSLILPGHGRGDGPGDLAISAGRHNRRHYLSQTSLPEAAAPSHGRDRPRGGHSAMRRCKRPARDRAHGHQVDGPGGPRSDGPSGRASIEFENVSFRIQSDTPVLRHVSFSLGPRRVLGLLGRTGSGKTTLSQLLFRLYDPQKGSVRLGDVDVRNVPSAELRRLISMVTQDVQLFQSSVRDNLTLFDPSIRDDRIQESILALGSRSGTGRSPMD